jgi:hypothetical protein
MVQRVQISESSKNGKKTNSLAQNRCLLMQYMQALILINTPQNYTNQILSQITIWPSIIKIRIQNTQINNMNKEYLKKKELTKVSFQRDLHFESENN